MDDVDVFAYDSVEDLETTIDTVVDRQQEYNEAVRELLEETGRFLRYEHDPDRMDELAHDVASGYGSAGSGARIAHEYAQKELEDPTEADNWDRLEEAAEASRYVDDQLATAHRNAWQQFGFDEDDLIEQYEGMIPFADLLWAWDNDPHVMLGDEDRYEAGWGDREPGPTLARMVEEPSGGRMTRKQRDDRRRGAELDRILDRPDREPGYIKEAADPSVWTATMDGEWAAD
jgi:ribosomal protein L22